VTEGKAVGLVRSDSTAIYMSRERGGSMHELGWISHRKLLLWKQPNDIWSTGYKAFWRLDVVYNRMSKLLQSMGKSVKLFPFVINVSDTLRIGVTSTWIGVETLLG